MGISGLAFGVFGAGGTLMCKYPEVIRGQRIMGCRRVERGGEVELTEKGVQRVKSNGQNVRLTCGCTFPADGFVVVGKKRSSKPLETLGMGVR